MTLPGGWVETTLADTCERVIDGSHNPPKASAAGQPMLSARNIYDRSIHFDEIRYIEPDAFENEDRRTQIKPGSVLLTIVGALGRSAVVPQGSDRFTVQRSVGVLHPHEGICPQFLARRFDTDESQRWFFNNARGTAQKGVYLRTLAKFAFQLPPTAEQRRIVAKLDALTARLARARAELDRVPVLAERLRTLALVDALAPDERGHVPMGELLADVRYGTAQKCNYRGGDSPVLRIPNVQAGRIDLSDLKSSTFTTKELAKLSLQAGDVLVIRSNGSLDLVGKSAVVEGDAVGMLYAGYLIRLRPLPGNVVPRFLHHFLSSPTARTALTGAARSTSGVNNVNAQQLQALKVPVRSVEEQHEIVSRIDNALARADRMEAEAARARALIDRLEAAILAKAFRGELVPQDPNDEPASVLLDRIRAERAAMPKRDQRGRRKSERGGNNNAC